MIPPSPLPIPLVLRRTSGVGVGRSCPRSGIPSGGYGYNLPPAPFMLGHGAMGAGRGRRPERPPRQSSGEANMDMRGAIRAVTEGRDLTPEEMSAVMRIIMTGEATEAQIGGFLIGLRMKGERVGEIAAAAEVMRDLSAKVEVDLCGLVDVVGTGGDAVHTFNISTASALVAAGAGPRWPSTATGRSPALRGRRTCWRRGRQPRPLTGRGRAVHRGGRHRFHVRAEAPLGHATRHRTPAGDGGAHRLQTSSGPSPTPRERPTSSWECSHRSGCGRSRRF